MNTKSTKGLCLYCRRKNIVSSSLFLLRDTPRYPIVYTRVVGQSFQYRSVKYSRSNGFFPPSTFMKVHACSRSRIQVSAVSVSVETSWPRKTGPKSHQNSRCKHDVSFPNHIQDVVRSKRKTDARVASTKTPTLFSSLGNLFIRNRTVNSGT